MTQYLSSKPFTVQQRGRDARSCTHGWRNAKGVCVFCGDVAPKGPPASKEER